MFSVGVVFDEDASTFSSYPSPLVRQAQHEGQRVYKGVWDCAVKMVRAKGWRLGLFTGWWPTVFRDTPAFANYFLIYEGLKWALREERWELRWHSSPTGTGTAAALPLPLASSSPSSSLLAPSGSAAATAAPAGSQALAAAELEGRTLPPPSIAYSVSFPLHCMLLAGAVAGVATWLGTYPVMITTLAAVSVALVDGFGRCTCLLLACAWRGCKSLFRFYLCLRSCLFPCC